MSLDERSGVDFIMSTSAVTVLDRDLEAIDEDETADEEATLAVPDEDAQLTGSLVAVLSIVFGVCLMAAALYILMHASQYQPDFSEVRIVAYGLVVVTIGTLDAIAGVCLLVALTQLSRGYALATQVISVALLLLTFVSLVIAINVFGGLILLFLQGFLFMHIASYYRQQMANTIAQATVDDSA
ncbi:unnamed protein product [marine sediment metagenome]|uniref:Uncharacterized protein n=1 Tax=marine sediment metagenome TaxID=412755 RepID=X0SG14_9ZZZZ